MASVVGMMVCFVSYLELCLVVRWCEANLVGQESRPVPKPAIPKVGNGGDGAEGLAVCVE